MSEDRLEVKKIEEVRLDVGMEKKFVPYDHHPVNDERKPLSREEFVRAAATGLFDFDEVFKDSEPTTNEFQCSKHTYSEWMNAFIRYSSW